MSIVVTLTILVRSMSVAACLAVLRLLSREKSSYLLVTAAAIVILVLSYFLFREVAELIDAVPLQESRPQSDPEILTRLSTATAGLLTIVIIQQLLVQRQTAEENLRIRDAEIAHVSRVTTAGELLSGVTHELAQPLTAISNHSAALRNRLRKEPVDTIDSIRESTEKISKEASRAASILGGLRRFLANSKPQRSVVDLHELTHEAAQLVRCSGKFDRIKIDLVLIAEPSLVYSNPIEITQVIVNLILNACESFEDEDSGECVVTLATSIDQSTIVLSVTDNGPGLSTEVMGRMYDPFFTTKQNGMGMGLAISRTILSRHEGSLSHVSGMPRGAGFTVVLPLANTSD